MLVNPCKDCITFAICKSCIYPWLKKSNHTLLFNYYQLIEPKCKQLTDYIKAHHKETTTKNHMAFIPYKQRMKIESDIIRKTFIQQ